MFKKIAHIGVAVKNVDASSRVFERIFGIRRGNDETLPDQQVSTTMFTIGGTAVELIQPTTPDSSVMRFIEKRGEGVHHVSFEVDDIVNELARLKKEGFQLIDEKPRKGTDNTLVAFLHPKSTNGLLIEISQKQE